MPVNPGPGFNRVLDVLRNEIVTYTTDGKGNYTEVPATGEWETKVKGLLKAELKRRNVSYVQLVEKLAEIGVVDSEPNVRNKLSRGKFTAVFLIQCLEAIGAKELRLG